MTYMEPDGKDCMAKSVLLARALSNDRWFMDYVIRWRLYESPAFYGDILEEIKAFPTIYCTELD